MSSRMSAVQIDAELERMEFVHAELLAEDLELLGWGKWSRQEGSTLGYPKCLLPFMSKGWGERDLSRQINDIPEDSALRIDAAIAKLPLQHKTVIVAIYRAWIPIRSLPAKLGMPRSRMEQYHNQALGILWAALK